MTIMSKNKTQGPDVTPHLEFLERNGILPDPSSATFVPKINPEKDVVSHVDWDRLFPAARLGENHDPERPWLSEDEWQPELNEEFLSELGRILEGGDYHNPTPSCVWDGSLPCEEQTSHWDSCAWYRPIHYFGSDWGILIKQSCAERKALRIARFLARSLSPYLTSRWDLWAIGKWLIKISFLKYFLHEHFHHKVESLGFRFHVIFGASLYLPYKDAVYRKHFLTSDCLEESLANADAYRRLGNKPYVSHIGKAWLPRVRDYLEFIDFPSCPPGYKEALHYLKDDDFNKKLHLLHGQMKEATLTPSQPVDDWVLASRLTQSMFNVKSRIWEVVPRGRSALLPTTSCKSKLATSASAYHKMHVL